jgi:predicted secreted Zn-dependent protease
VAALRVHEDGHKQIALDAANDAIARVRSETVATCKDLNVYAKSAVDAATSIGNRRDQQYDAATRHGATQGARFP